MKKNLKALGSLIFAIILCVSTVYAWLISNEQVSVNGISLQLITEEGGSIILANQSGMDNFSIVPNKKATIRLKTINDLDEFNIYIIVTYPTREEFYAFFSEVDNQSLLNGEYLKNYYDNLSNDLYESYVYDVSNLNIEEKISFLYSFLEENDICKFFTFNTYIDNVEQQLIYNEEKECYVLETSLKENQEFNLNITFGGNNVYPISTYELDNEEKELKSEYLCKNLNCFLMSKIKISFSKEN